MQNFSFVISEGGEIIVSVKKIDGYCLEWNKQGYKLKGTAEIMFAHFKKSCKKFLTAIDSPVNL